MAEQKQNPFPLFYQNPVPLDASAHAKLALKSNFGLNFTSKVNAVPINLIEMPQICHSYPIAFSPDGNATPVAILGLRDNENLFLNEDGEWAQDHYIPAYIRRYPFIFSEMPDSDQLTLCIDTTKDTVEENATAKNEQKFFDETGQPTVLAKNALEFCKSYHSAVQQTIEFSKALVKSGLLVTRQAEISLPTGQKVSFAGFQVIDEEKLAKLDDATFLDWRRKNWLPFIYAHLFSGGRWQSLTKLLNDRIRTREAA